MLEFVWKDNSRPQAWQRGNSGRRREAGGGRLEAGARRLLALCKERRSYVTRDQTGLYRVFSIPEVVFVVPYERVLLRVSTMYFKDLLVWQRAMDLVDAIYDATEVFPPHELYGLVSQMRRAANSVPSNIGESQGTLTRGGARKALSDARASLWELDTQIEIAKRRRYVAEETASVLLEQLNQVGKLLMGLIRYTVRKQRRDGQNAYLDGIE